MIWFAFNNFSGKSFNFKYRTVNRHR